MADQMDLARLRSLIEGVLITLYQRYRHQDLGALCERLRLPPPPPNDGPTKHERLTASLRHCPDNRLAEVADAILDSEPLTAPERNPLQDVVWLGRHHVAVPGRTRRELAKEFDLTDHLMYPDRFLALLGQLWDLGEDEFNVWGPHLGTLRADIERHVIRFRDDWSTEHLFEQLGAFEATHPRFGCFLEGLASPDVLPDEQAQRRFVDLANHHLQPVGAQLRQEGEADGYPLFHLSQLGQGTARRPRNLIFATLGKPDIRFTSALDNDIEVAERADQVLVYDHAVGKEGLLWRDLLSWWQETRSITDPAEASLSLYDRMKASLPRESPGQNNLFWLYHNIYKDNLGDVPALLPEIWVHWDPKTVRERGARALQNLRMDFLMLLPGNRRVVLEVDGIQHFTRNGGAEPDSGKYAATMAGDRDLKFQGYEVFRFGHDELRDRDRARTVLTRFFRTLLNQPSSGHG
jgi:very-short-patch-repair endonuclease